MKKLLVLLLLAGLAYWFVKDRLGGDAEEFVFTEAPATEPPTTEAPSTPPADPPPAE